MTSQFLSDQFFTDLHALAESAFPKRCASCGYVYETAEQFLAETVSISPDKTGLKSSVDDDGAIIVEAFRNCACGSTLMDFFSNRRDSTPAGLARRQKIGEMLDYLQEQGLDFTTARAELLKVLHGGKSEILKQYRPPSKSK
jgi:hypothetical protein